MKKIEQALLCPCPDGPDMSNDAISLSPHRSNLEYVWEWDVFSSTSKVVGVLREYEKIYKKLEKMDALKNSTSELDRLPPIPNDNTSSNITEPSIEKEWPKM